MPSEPLRRRHYYSDPRDSTLHPLVDVNNVQIYDTQLRNLPPDYLETSINTNKYVDALERMHSSGPHGWGIAQGLGIKATMNQAGVGVLSGVAIDAAGRHVALAEGAGAEIGPDASNPAVSPQIAAVTAAGVTLATAGLNGAYYVTIAWCETLDSTLWAMSSQQIPEMRHTPWLRLEPVAGITDATDDGSRIVLGRVQINAGNVTALTPERRREVGLPAGTLQFWRGVTTSPAPNLAAANTRTGEIRARATGGIDVRVTDPNDQIDFHRDDGTNVARTINKVTIGAEQIVGRRADGRETVRINPQHGNIALGTQGVEGDVTVYDANNRLVITLDGSTASLVVGAAGNEGDILVKDAVGQNSVRVDGNTGTTFTRRVGTATGNAIDVDTSYLRVHAHDLILDGRSARHQRPFRALVDMDNRLEINFATDYTNGVDIRKLHLSEHIKTGVVEGFDTSKRPTYDQWITLEQFGINLPWSQWNFMTSCTFGMLDDGEVDNFWAGVLERSFPDANGDITIKWEVNYHDRGDDWRPFTWTVSWIAFRR